VSNPTNPFSWQMPTPTDLVTDLPADFEVFGQAVATSLADLLGGTSGQILAKNSNTDMDFVWIANDQGDITGITASSPLTGGGTSGAVTVGIQDATTSQKGAVQLENSTSSTSTTTAAVPASVKSAYDLANAAIPKSLIDAAGDLIVGTANDTAGRLGIGTAGQILKVNSGATALEWGTATASATDNFQLLNAGGTALTGAATITVSSISNINRIYVRIIGASSVSASSYFLFRMNTDSGANYEHAITGSDNEANTAANNFLLGRMGTAAGDSFNGFFLIDGTNAAGRKPFQGIGVGNGGSARWYNVSGSYFGTSTISSVSIISETGNFDAGTIYIYGA
jgi:hypothetical protein